MTLTIADVSEFQGIVRPPAGTVIIVRAYNGWRADNDWVANRANAHAAPVAALGIYAYLVASVDAATQANALCDLVGTLAANEWLICDLEEGSGDQQPRWAAWRAAVETRFPGRVPWLYSGESFAASTGLGVPDWEAAYQSNEPVPNPKLWQNTDAYPYPWGAADSSVFNGTLPEFLVATGIVTPPTPAKDPDMPSVQNIVLPVDGPRKVALGVPPVDSGAYGDVWVSVECDDGPVPLRCFVHNSQPGWGWRGFGPPGSNGLFTIAPTDPRFGFRLESGDDKIVVSRTDPTELNTASVMIEVFAAP